MPFDYGRFEICFDQSTRYVQNRINRGACTHLSTYTRECSHNGNLCGMEERNMQWKLWMPHQYGTLLFHSGWKMHTKVTSKTVRSTSRINRNEVKKRCNRLLIDALHVTNSKFIIITYKRQQTPSIQIKNLLPSTAKKMIESDFVELGSNIKRATERAW